MGQSEKWRNIPGYANKYQASNLGNIRKLCEDGSYSILSGCKNLQGEIQYFDLIGPENCPHSKFPTAHKLVATTWIPNPKKRRHVHHIDGNKSNNAVCNLEWVSLSECTDEDWL